MISNRRTRIKPEDEDAGGKGENLASAIGELEVNIISSSKVKLRCPSELNWNVTKKYGLYAYCILGQQGIKQHFRKRKTVAN